MLSQLLIHQHLGAQYLFEVCRTHHVMSFRPRCGLSPSPATGLVGMQENAFLSDFFACVGFLPLTTAAAWSAKIVIHASLQWFRSITRNIIP